MRIQDDDGTNAVVGDLESRLQIQVLESDRQRLLIWVPGGKKDSTEHNIFVTETPFCIRTGPQKKTHHCTQNSLNSEVRTPVPK